jgi:hypothetical protein
VSSAPTLLCRQQPAKITLALMLSRLTGGHTYELSSSRGAVPGYASPRRSPTGADGRPVSPSVFKGISPPSSSRRESPSRASGRGPECTSKPERPSPTHSAKSLSALSRSLDRNGRASSPQRQRQLAQMQTGIVLQRTGSGALESTSSPQRQRQAAQMQTGIVLQRTSSGALESAGFAAAAAAADGASGINSSRSTDRSRRSGSPRAAVSLGAMRQIRADWEAMATETAATAKKVAQPPRMRQRLRRQQQEEEEDAAAAAAERQAEVESDTSLAGLEAVEQEQEEEGELTKEAAVMRCVYTFHFHGKGREGKGREGKGRFAAASGQAFFFCLLVKVGVLPQTIVD